jgi:flagellar motor switch protein FliM
MSEQILSQEEIDALLSAMANGEVDLEEDAAQEVEAVPYDLTSQSITLNSQFHALEEVYDKFCTALQTSLSTSLKRTMEVKFVSSEIVKYVDFLKAFSNPTGFNLFTLEPLIGSAMLVLEPSLLFSLIDCMFGGDGRPLEQDRPFSLVDKNMMKKFAAETLQHYQEAWKHVFRVTASLKKIETKPEFVHLTAPDDTVIAIAFSLGSEAFSGHFYFCMSYLMLEPIKERLCSTVPRQIDSALAWNRQLQELLKDTEVNVIAELGRVVQTVGDLLSLQVDEVLSIGAGPEDLIDVTVENVPKYAGYPGIVKGNRAVQIAGPIDPSVSRPA